jgi:spore coat polysaccharide biosynthesis protein SpsF
MRIVTIIQARMGSARLPGKVMKDLGGETVLARVVRRVRRATLMGEVTVATTTEPSDDVILQECRRLSVQVFRGAQDDVLDRYYCATQLAKAEAIIRITSDCPLIEPAISDKTVLKFLDEQPDYASNALERTYPRGLDTEVMTREALARAWQQAQQPYQRVHVTPYIYENPSRFRILSVTGETDYSSHRWTLDTAEDLTFLRAVYARMGNDDHFTWHDVLTVLDKDPSILNLNRSVSQKMLHDV